MKFKSIDEKWMKYAFNLAKKSKLDVPVGSVLVLNDIIIGKGYNSILKSKDPTAHAEIIAIRAGSKKINNYRINNSILYVTLEPCIMCIGAILHARIKKIIFSLFNKTKLSYKKFHFILKSLDMKDFKNIHLKKKCNKQIKDFFKKIR
ncbi:MAG: nucleoside deaminase [Enterobacteriaceae bacterium]